MSTRASAQDVAIAATLAIGVAGSRLPFRGAMLYHWDSINFARGLDRFDVAAAQPQIPGYLVYVLIGRAARWIIGDAQPALVAISIVGSGLAVAMLYLLAVELFERRTAVIAALCLATSPLYWFYGEIALPHAFDAFLILTAIWLAWRIMTGTHHLVIVLAVWLALAGGVRPQSETFLMPLVLYALVRGGWNRYLVPAFALWVICNLAWLLPLLWLSGGPAAYSATSRAFYARFSDTTAIWSGGLWGLTRNSLKLSMYTAYGWAFGLTAVLAGAVAARRWRWPLRDPRLHMIVLWILPPLGVYLFIHMGQQGLVFVYLPALCLVSALALKLLPQGTASILAAFILVANALTFVLAPTFPLGGDRPKLLTVDTLHRHDASLLARIAAVEKQLPAAHTVLLSSGWRFPEYYLPQYALLHYTLGARWEIDEGRPVQSDRRWIDLRRRGVNPDARNEVAVVLFDNELVPFNRSPDRLTWLPLADGERLAVLRLQAGEGLHLDGDSFAVGSLDTATLR